MGVGLVLLIAGGALFSQQPASAVIALVFAWVTLAYGAFGRKTLLSELFLTLGWGSLLLFIIYVYNGSQRWWIGLVIGAITLIDLIGMLRRRAYRQARTSDEAFAREVSDEND